MAAKTCKKDVIGFLQRLLKGANLESTTEELLLKRLSDHFKEDMSPFASDVQEEIEKFVVMHANQDGEQGAKRGRENCAPDTGKSKAAKSAKKNQAATEYLLSEDGLTRLVVKEFKKTVYVDIRVHYEREGQMWPTKKGLMLPVAEWQTLAAGIPSIQTALESKDFEFKLQLAPLRRVAISDYIKRSICVDLRECYEQDGELKPTQRGIMLRQPHFQALCECVGGVNAALAKLSADGPAAQPAAGARQEADAGGSGIATKPEAKAQAKADGGPSVAANAEGKPAAIGRKTKNSQGEPRWLLGVPKPKLTKFASVGSFNGKQNVSVREYFDKGGEWISTKKGLNLALDQFQTLCSSLKAVGDAVAATDGSLRVPLSDKRTAFTSEYRGKIYVHLREWSPKEGEDERVKRRGVCLNPDEWQTFASIVPDIQAELQGQ
eukprot:jgi/Ulvmu1/2461/UM136_0013.1